MKIAQIAPLMESVPPRLYGGTERIVSYLIEELVRQGHDVTLFASADLAFRHGSVSEVVDQGVTGAIVGTVDEAVRMLPQVLALDRHAVRHRLEQRFSSARMATDYIALYRSLLKQASISECEAAVPRPVLGKRLNGQGLMAILGAAHQKRLAYSDLVTISCPTCSGSCPKDRLRNTQIGIR
jgi:hypothetical protein